jgi:preprotein translocase subunit SecD
MSKINSLWRRFIVIVLITVAASYIAFPPELPINIHFAGINFEKTITRAPLDLKLGSFQFFRDLNLHLGLDLAGGSHLEFEGDVSKIPVEDQQSAMEAARDTIERRVNIFGVSEAQVTTSKTGNSQRIIVELPGVKDGQQAASLIGETAKVDFREEIPEASPSGLLTLENTKPTGFTGQDLLRAKPAFDTTSGQPIVSFEIKPESAKKFGDITERLIGRRLVVFLDEYPVSAPTVQTPITDGQGQISGQFTSEATKTLSGLLNSGALPVPIQLIEQRTVEASLGQEAVNRSMIAAGVGLGMVALFMILSYGRLGILAVVALAIYGVLALSVYKLVPIVLTLPGIAGFILSFGMTVDTNILIFERMKEELRAGRSWKSAMEAGFGRAWSSIRDANVATVLISLILLNPFNFSFLHTSGPVRGFAITLIIGVILSLFTGIFVSRTLLRLFSSRKD